ncbi:hypothetical protein [Brucella intermedia]|uniref:Uncharacterized protein n=1 Tax=Brucella intermedia TaxID=94625 RepID=A0A7V6PC58_9HYPH|nr:hypothetical protein [Brucella intermedia]WGG58473.1 hypothetical protein QA414_08965 [Brucella intermedia]HHV68259.1 hypothetical protein [Brucella intermedia]
MSGTPISQRIIALNICFLLPVENPTFLMNDCSIGQDERGAVELSRGGNATQIGRIPKTLMIRQ